MESVTSMKGSKVTGYGTEERCLILGRNKKLFLLHHVIPALERTHISIQQPILVKKKRH
jgi:hypothetical protein